VTACAPTCAPAPAATAARRSCLVQGAACAARSSGVPSELDARGGHCRAARLDRRDRRPPHTTSQRDSGKRAAPRWQRERNRWPSAQLVRSRFRGWDAALRGVGLPGALAPLQARRAHCCPQARRAGSAGFPSSTNGRPPPPTARTRRAWCVPSLLGRRAPRRRLEPPPTRHWSDGEIGEALRAWTARHGRPPLVTDWRRAAPDPHRRPCAAPLRIPAGGPSRPPVSPRASS
jgi:hypothetical protein